MQYVNVVQPTEPILTPAEQAWLDACPVGDSRSLTSCGRTATVDRRFAPGPPVQVPTFTIQPRWEIGLPGSPTYDSTGQPPLQHVTVTSADGHVWRPDIKTSYPRGPDIAIQSTGGSYVQTSFRLAAETLIALA